MKIDTKWLMTICTGFSFFFSFSGGEVQAAGINVQTFGAFPNDPLDDTEEIQRAIDALPLQGGTIQFPSGVYLLSTSEEDGTALKIRKAGVKIIGTNVEFKAISDMRTMLSIEGSNHLIASSRLSALKSEIRFNGNFLANRGILIHHASWVQMKNTQIQNMSQPTDSNHRLYHSAPIGIQISGNTKNITLSKLDIRNIQAINTAGPLWNHKVARGLLVTTTSADPIPQNVTINQSNFYNIGPKDDGDCIAIQTTTELSSFKVLNNTFEKCHKRAIKVQASGVTIAGNIIKNNFLNDNFYETYDIPKETDVSDMYAAISIHGNAVSVTGNKISGTGSFYRGIEASVYTEAEGTGLIISGNSLRSGEKANLTNTTGIYVFHYQQPVIKSNTIYYARRGIVAEGKMTNPKIESNTIDVRNVLNDTTGDAGIDIRSFANPSYETLKGTPQQVVIRSNTLYSERNGIHVPESSLHPLISLNKGAAGWKMITYPGYEWKATFETGDWTDWSVVQGIRAGEGPGAAYVYVADAASEGIVAKTGTKVGRFELPAGDLPHSKVFKEWSNVGKKDQFQRVQEKLPNNGSPNGTYEAWYYFPSGYQFTSRSWTNIFQFKEEGYTNGIWNQEPSWAVNVSSAAAWKKGGREPVLFINHWKNNWGYVPKMKPVPLGKWFSIRAELYEKNRIDWYIDGVLFDRSYHKKYPVGRMYPQSNGWIFGVGHYLGEGQIWIDDASFKAR